MKINEKIIKNIFPMEIFTMSFILAIFFTYIIDLSVLNYYYDNKKYYDFGVSLFLNKNPGELIYLYLTIFSLFIAFCFIIGCKGFKYQINLRSNYSWAILSALSSFIMLALYLNAYNSIFFQYSLWGLLILLAIINSSFFAKYENSINKIIEPNINNLIILLCSVILLLSLTKIRIIGYLINSVSNFYLTLYLILILIIIVFFASRVSSELRQKRAIVVGISLLIYLATIRIPPINWGVDVFHEGESLLMPSLFLSGKYEFLKDIFPVHGLFRNISHGYFLSLVDSYNDIYIARISKIITYPLINSLVFILVLRYTKSLFIALSVFIIFFTSGIFNDWDRDLFIPIIFIMLPLYDDKKSKYIIYLIGILFFLVSIYSVEFYIFFNLAILFATLLCFLNGNILKISKLILIYLAISILSLLCLSENLYILFDILFQSLGKSPSLLESLPSFPENFEFDYFFAIAYFPFFLFSIAFIAYKSIIIDKISSYYSYVFLIFCFLLAMFFIRGLNRADIGHILYAYYYSAPIFLCYIFHNKVLKIHSFNLIIFIIIIFQFVSLYATNRLSFDILKFQRNYDGVFKEADVRQSERVGGVKAPSATINDSIISKSELNLLETLITDGYNFYDLTNQPVLFYGILQNRTPYRDIHTIFSNTYKEQEDIISSLGSISNLMIVLSAGHWSETIDNSYAEYRLPILYEYILKYYPNFYNFGRFLTTSKVSIPGDYDKSLRPRVEYNLGYAPYRLRPYPQEKFTTTTASTSLDDMYVINNLNALNIKIHSKINSTIRIQLFNSKGEKLIITFNVPSGESSSFVRLSNLPAYSIFKPNNMNIKYDSSIVKIDKLDYLTK